MGLCAPAGGAGPAGWWRMEGKAGASAAGGRVASGVGGDAAAAEPHKREGGSLEFAAAVRGKFIYDPLTQKSYRNGSSLRFSSDGKASDYLEVRLPAAGDADASGSEAGGAHGLTIEAFVKLDKEHSAPVAVKSRTSPQAAEIAIQPVYLPRWRQTYYGGNFTPPGGRRREVTTGSYVSISRIRKDNLAWRHLAVVYDARARTVTYYTDHYETRTVEAPAAMRWDNGALYIGGRPGAGGFSGLIDEVRLTRRALRPSQFLRARADAIEGVSFDSAETVLPADSGCVDLKKGFGAAGDGRTDDTAALQRAFHELSSHVPLGYHTLVIPPGTYLVKDTVKASRFIIIRGTGPARTVIKLADRCRGYDDKRRPKSVVEASSTSGPPGSNRRTNGSSIGNYLSAFTVDTGRGNPGAVGLEFHTNNHGAVQDVVIRSGDGSGYCGLGLRHHDVGPGLIKNVQVVGFDYGTMIAHQEYSMTLEHVTFEGQNVAAVRDDGNILAMRKIVSRNKVPAVLAPGGNTMIALLDSALTGGSPEAYAIRSGGGLYVRNLTTAGYKAAIEKRIERRRKGKPTTWKTELVPGPDVKEFVGDGVVDLWDGAGGALDLPVEETPAVPWGDIHADWVNVRGFADKVVRREVERKGGKKQVSDWSAAIQAAIDSGALCVYFPWQRGGYPVARSVHLRGKVRRLLGMKTGIARLAGGEGAAVVYDQPDAAHVTVIEHLSLGGLHHASPGTLVLRHASPGRYTNAAGCGKLFIEDVVGSDYRFEHPQKVWVRQWNVERHAKPEDEFACIVSKGATIWCLGFKTEYESEKLRASDGARTEIFAAFIYPIGRIPADRPIFRNTDSRMAVQYGTSVYRANHRTHVIDTRGGKTKTAGNDHLKWSGSRARMDLYVSKP
jgi:hypothetical protein